MDRDDWNRATSAETAHRRAGGRRRYNAMRRRRAKARRDAIAQAIVDPWLVKLGPRGGIQALADAFGVHRTTIWRDLQRMYYPPRRHEFYYGGELLFTVLRACQGGPIVAILDADDSEIQGEARRRILRSLPRYYGRRRRRPVGLG